MSRRIVVLAGAALVFAGCAEKEEPGEPPTLRLDIERPVAPADGGTQTGHRGGLSLTTKTGSVRFTGAVRPRDAEILFRAPGAATRVQNRNGRVTFTASGLRRGRTKLEVVVRSGGIGVGETVTVTRR